MSDRLLAGIFAAMAAVSLLLMLLPQTDDKAVSEPSYRSAALAGGGVGFFSGIIGQGGGFILLPVMSRFLKVPLRTAIGTSCGVALLSALAGFLGKWGTGQVPLRWGLAVSLGALIGGGAGCWFRRRVSNAVLERILLLVIIVSSARLLFLALR